MLVWADERFQLQVGLRTDAGRERPVNEDTLGGPESQSAELLARKGSLYVVADGMGGHVAGSLASDQAVHATIEEYYGDPSLDIEESLVAAVEQANAAVYAQAQDPAYQGMGSTLVAAVVRGSELVVANVGDSRAYLIRAQSIVQLTQDHSWVEEQRRAGVLTDEEAKNHPYSHVITRSLGATSQVQVDLFAETLQPGDIVIVCSDGLWGAVSSEQMSQVATTRPAQRAADELVALANAGGGSDNISTVVIQVGMASVAPRPARSSLACSPVIVATLLMGVAVIGLTILLLARGPASRPPQSKATPPKTAAMAPTRPAAASAVALGTPARTPTPAKPTATLFPSPTPPASTGSPSLPFRVGQTVRICADCKNGVRLRKTAAGEPIDGLYPPTELTIMGTPTNADLCHEVLGFRLNCHSYVWWPVRTKGDPNEEGWVAQDYLEPLPGR